MRATNILTILTLGAIASPASATYSLQLGPTPVSGTTTTTVIQSGCPGGGVCSVTQTPFFAMLSGPFDSGINALDGTFTLTGYNPGPRASYTVTVSFLNGALQSTSLTGYSYQLSGLCPGCVVTENRFTGANFALNVTDMSTGATSVLAPVPEPSTWALLFLGFGAIAVASRRRKPRTAVAFAKAAVA